MEYFPVAPPRLEFGLCQRNLQPRSQITAALANAKVVIGIALHNQCTFIRSALISAINQTLDEGVVAVIILDDSSVDQWEHKVDDLLQDPRVLVIDGVCGSPSHSRNAILDFVDQNLSGVQWVARLDADDILDNAYSVNALVRAAEDKNAFFALGSNYLVVDGVKLSDPNIANPDVMLNQDRLAGFVESFCTGKSKHELPSCNLLMQRGCGFRYPLVKSAEDHWLVAALLMFHSDKAAIVSTPMYSRYSLSGVETDVNRAQGKWQIAREKLCNAVREWHRAISDKSLSILGYGQEGIVCEKDNYIFKYFYASTFCLEEISLIQRRVQKCPLRFPQFDFTIGTDSSVVAFYPKLNLSELSRSVDLAEVRRFLLDLISNKVVVTNIKRDNLRLSPQNDLIYIDIGRDIVEFTVSGFLECAAKLYAIAYLNLNDHEVGWRQSLHRQEDQLKSLAGFEQFYGELIQTSFPHCKLNEFESLSKIVNDNVTLLIKACAQDASSLVYQVRHIVGNLCCDRQFRKVILLLDSFQGPFLRQYQAGNFEELVSNADKLLADKWVDQILIAPCEVDVIQCTYHSWFGIDNISSSHTSIGAPLFAQIWAFDQIDTPFVLQCDVDILVGRKDVKHDYLQDMLCAISSPGMWSVGFNIPKFEIRFNKYHASEFGYVPEVRFSLLDLQKIKKSCPLPNQIEDDKLKLMWHRSMELRQQDGIYKSMRGGDPRTFYIHIQNRDKPTLDKPLLRDLVGQGIYPTEQADKWDILADLNWKYPKRSEQIVFLMKGRNTSLDKIERALNSLLIQSDQDFGLIYIDDASDRTVPFDILSLLAPFIERLTLIRREVRAGYIPNFQLAVNEICESRDTLLVVLDQDDALMSDQVVTLLRNARDQGADLINGKMFRPNKPLKNYAPDYTNSRSKGGANVWAHLRGFTKQLFSEVPQNDLIDEERWFDELTDFVTMIPMVERAKCATYMDGDYFYWHERDDYSPEKKRKQEQMKLKILSPRYLDN